MSTKEQIIKNLPVQLQKILENESFSNLEEIRLRANRSLVVCNMGNNKILPYTVTQSDVEQTLQIISGASIYAYIEEIKNCFITLEGGHRVGLCGRVVVNNGQVINVIQISGINIRVARQIKGAANKVMPYIKNGSLHNTLIISPPQCGKTTILRDISRQLGQDYKISIIDERGEIAAMHSGIPQHDVGVMTDVLDLCPKSVGIPLMLRSMSPDVIITDEIAHCDIGSIQQALSCGVKIIATAHGDNIKQVLKRIKLDSIIDEFGCIITLSRRNGVGTIENIN